VKIWFCGLASPEMHLARVARRVAQGGHDIPPAKIRERWRTSRENLIRLLPFIHHLRVYDNSAEADPAVGHAPRPVLWLEMKEGRITAPADLSGAPEWVQPILGAAFKLPTGEGRPPLDPHN
jgi:predicted ABC-type ATPase